MDIDPKYLNYARQAVAQRFEKHEGMQFKPLGCGTELDKQLLPLLFRLRPDIAKAVIWDKTPFLSALDEVDRLVIQWTIQCYWFAGLTNKNEPKMDGWLTVDASLLLLQKQASLCPFDMAKSFESFIDHLRPTQSKEINDQKEFLHNHSHPFSLPTYFNGLFGRQTSVLLRRLFNLLNRNFPRRDWMPPFYCFQVLFRSQHELVVKPWPILSLDEWIYQSWTNQEWQIWQMQRYLFLMPRCIWCCPSLSGVAMFKRSRKYHLSQFSVPRVMRSGLIMLETIDKKWNLSAILEAIATDLTAKFQPTHNFNDPHADIRFVSRAFVSIWRRTGLALFRKPTWSMGSGLNSSRHSRYLMSRSWLTYASTWIDHYRSAVARYQSNMCIRQLKNN